jgi:hypothetical protein
MIPIGFIPETRLSSSAGSLRASRATARRRTPAMTAAAIQSSRPLVPFAGQFEQKATKRTKASSAPRAFVSFVIFCSKGFGVRRGVDRLRPLDGRRRSIPLMPNPFLPTEYTEELNPCRVAPKPFLNSVSSGCSVGNRIESMIPIGFIPETRLSSSAGSLQASRATARRRTPAMTPVAIQSSRPFAVQFEQKARKRTKASSAPRAFVSFVIFCSKGFGVRHGAASIDSDLRTGVGVRFH